MTRHQRETLRRLRGSLDTDATDAKPASDSADGTGTRSSRLSDALKHPLVLTLVGFLLSGILGTYLTNALTARSHERDVEVATRDSALAAFTDLSDLVNERRERAALVASAVNRGAPLEELRARKAAYDESYIRWNAKIPGDLLRIRAGLRLSYRSDYERYVDGLTNVSVLIYGTDADTLLKGQQLPRRPGLFSLMDSCLTDAADAAAADTARPSPAAVHIIADCKFFELYRRAVTCFSTVSESLFGAINLTQGAPLLSISNQQLINACTPP